MEEMEFHKKMAVELFNATWDLMDKKDRTKEDNDAMIHSAHASRYHWGLIGKPENLERGEWQISRVYTVLGMGETALHHAKRCLEICREKEIGDWDLAFAYEAVARAYKTLGDEAMTKEFVKKAREAGEKIAEQGDKDYFISELETI